MKLAQSLIFITSTALLSGCIVVASPSHAEIHSQQELSIDAQALKALDVEAGAGSLVISGSDDATNITVIADIYTDSSHAKNYQLELTNSGTTARLVAKINSNGLWQGDSARINVKVTLPSYLMLKVDDGSGSTLISDIYGTVDVKDGSGELTIENINSDVNVNDGSGSLTVSEVIGNVTIIDGSGEITINEIDGNVDIDDGSGSIYASAISGDAVVDDGSGDLTLRKVDGVITIDDGSGDIDVEQAGGLKILDSGSGGLKVKKVQGGFEIDE